MAGKVLGSFEEESGYRELKDEEAKLSYLRAGLAKSLPRDEAFVAAIEARAAEVLPQYGLTCAWADKASNQVE